MSNPLSVRIPAWLSVTVIALAIAAVALTVELRRSPEVAVAGPGEPQKPIRVMMFVDPAEVRHSPRFRFTFGNMKTLAPYRAEESIDAVVAGAASDLERFRRLNAWARAQFEPGVPDPYPPIDARIILRDIRSGFTGGFCAQYNYVLAQAIQSLGYPARYVTVVNHEVLEAWERDHRRWICLDPLNAATYVDEGGEPLSVYDLYVRMRAGRPILPGPGSLPGTADRVAGAFERFSVWIKNNHVARPINFTDLATYMVRYVEPGTGAPEGAGLWTSELGDLYFDPDQLGFTARMHQTLPPASSTLVAP